MKTLIGIVVPLVLLAQLMISCSAYGGQSGLIKLDKDYLNEQKTAGTKYLTKNQRKNYELKISRDGLLLDSAGNVLHTSNLPGGTAMFVYSREGKIYISTFRNINGFTHSSLVAGEDVIVAGSMKIVRGTLMFMTDISQRYHTKKEGNLRAALYRLKVMGADLTAGGERTVGGPPPTVKLFFNFNE